MRLSPLLILVALSAAACDPCRKLGDVDEDGVCDDVDDDDDGDGCLDSVDAAPAVASGDSDGDSVADDCDLCDGDDAVGDTDTDGTCDDVDDDDDGDGCLDGDDAAPLVASGDSDSDGIHDDCDACEGDNATGDVDADGICDDLDIPGDITDLDATVDGDELSVTWANPADSDLAGVLLVVSPYGPPGFTPTTGTDYTVGEVVGDGIVAQITLTEAATVAAPAVGAPSFATAWAFDELGNYSAIPASDSDTRTVLGTQTGTLSIDLAGSSVSVTNQPDNFVLDASFVSNSSGTVIVTLGVTSRVDRLLFNLKAVTDGLNAGAQPGSTLWFDGDKPYVFFGPEAQEGGARVERTYTFTGLTGATDPVTVDLRFVDAPMLYGGNYGGDFGGIDTSMSGETWQLDFNDPDGAGDNLRQGTISPDGRYIYAGEKQTPFLSIFDTTTLEIVGGTNLSTAANGEGSVGGVAMSPDGASVYAVFNDGSHWHGYSESAGNVAVPTTVSLIEFDAETLAEVRRLTMYTDDGRSRTGRALAISPDGSSIVAALSDHDGDNKELWFVDVSTFTAVSGGDPVELSSPGQAEYLVWSDDGGTVGVGYNAYRYGTNAAVMVDLVDTGSFGITSVDPGTAATTSSVLATRGDKLYFAGRNSSTSGLAVIDLTDNSVTIPSVGSSQATGVVVEPTDGKYWVIDYNDCYPVDMATDAAIDVDGGDSVSTLDQFRAHVMVMSPF